MAVLNPEHLIDQAGRLVAPPPAGPPRQVDVRRAISAAYYAVFHAALIAMADEFIGKKHRGAPEYGLLYRAVHHHWARGLCEEVRKQQPGKKVAEFVPTGGFGPELQTFAAALVDLQEKRHLADYDPMVRVKTADALTAVSTARSAVRLLKKAPGPKRKRFLVLLAFPPR